jgi:hypothetical protein
MAYTGTTLPSQTVDSSGDTVIRLHAPIMAQATDFTASYAMGSGALSQGIKRPRREAQHLPPINAEAKHE